MKVVPQYFFQNATDFPLLFHKYEACLLYKCLHQNQLQGEYFVSAHVFTVVLQGKKIIHTDDGKRMEVGAGTAVFLPRDLYMIQDIIAEKGAFESWLFFLTDQQVGRFLETRDTDGLKKVQIQRDRPAELPFYDYSEALRLYCEGLTPLMKAVKRPAQLVDIKLQELMHIVAAGAGGDVFIEQLRQLKPERRNIKKLMEQHYDHPLKVEDYAYLSGRSVTSFHRDFKASFGTSPKQWLMDKRMEKASELLKSGERSVTTAAYDSGYENISHFIKAFKKRFGISPGKFSQHHTGLQAG